MFEEQCCTKWKNRWIPFFILICQLNSCSLFYTPLQRQILPRNNCKGPNTSGLAFCWPSSRFLWLFPCLWFMASPGPKALPAYCFQQQLPLLGPASALALLSSPSSLVGPPAHLPVANPLSVLSAPWQGWSFYLFCIQLAPEVSVTGLYWWCCRIY